MKKIKPKKRRKIGRAMQEKLQRAYNKGFRDGRHAEAMGSSRDW